MDATAATVDPYRHQSPLSDPGRHAARFDGLPDDLESLCRAIQGSYLHYRGAPASGVSISPERLLQVDSRRVETILDHLVTADDRPLIAERPDESRFVGCCRDAALLLCAMLRHRGRPARIRYGFATYLNFGHDFAADHVLTEYWDDGRWKLADAELSEPVRAHLGVDVDPLDVPRDRFLVGGVVWQGVREGRLDADRFGVHPDLAEPRGIDFVRGVLAKDITFLNREEYLLWDEWGLMDLEEDPTDADLAVLDAVAPLSIRAHRGDATDDAAIRALAAHPGFRTPATMTCYSPVQEHARVATLAPAG